MIFQFIKGLRVVASLVFFCIFCYWSYEAIIKLSGDNISSTVSFKNGDDDKGGIIFPLVTFCPLELEKAVQAQFDVERHCNWNIDQNSYFPRKVFWPWAAYYCIKQSPDKTETESSTRTTTTTTTEGFGLGGLFTDSPTESPHEILGSMEELRAKINLDLTKIVKQYRFGDEIILAPGNPEFDHFLLHDFQEFRDEFFGQCWTFDPVFLFRNQTTFETYFELELSHIIYNSSYVVAIHEKPADRVKAIRDANNRVIMSQGDNLLARFRKTVVKSLPSSTLHCTYDPGYEKAACKKETVERFYIEQTGCSMPWMEQSYNPWINSSRTFEICDAKLISKDGVTIVKTAQGFNKTITALDDFLHFWGALNTVSEKQKLTIGTCPNSPRCQRVIYEISQTTVDNSHLRYWKVGTGASRIRISLVDINVQYVVDQISYNAQSFIGEVGGTLGLLLGLSFLSAIDLLEFLTRKVVVITSKTSIESQCT